MEFRLDADFALLLYGLRDLSSRCNCVRQIFTSYFLPFQVLSLVLFIGCHDYPRKTMLSTTKPTHLHVLMDLLSHKQ